MVGVPFWFWFLLIFLVALAIVLGFRARRSRRAVHPHPAIVVRVVDEVGRPIDVADPIDGTFNLASEFDRLIPFFDSRFRCLGVVDPWGDTVFNQVQMPYLLEDLDRLDLKGATETQREGIRRLRLMAEHCRDNVHLYVKFIGD